MDWYLAVLKKYAEFEGRSTRQEYWIFVLFNLIFSFVAGILDAFLGTAGIIYAIYSLAVLVPGLAVSIRRLHDVGKSGWYLLISLIPIIGLIWILVLLCKDSSSETNLYGPNPKAVQN